MRRIAVLVDAGYFWKAAGRLIAKREVRREEIILDAKAIIDSLAEEAARVSNRELLRVYWYDAARGTPTSAHRDIAGRDRVKLRLGHVNSLGQQKGVDPLIITDMITLARNRACDDMLLLAGDGDLVVGVQQAQEHGVRVHILGIGSARANQSPQLRIEADTCREWDATTIGGFLRLASPEELQTLAEQAHWGRERPIAANPIASSEVSLGAPPTPTTAEATSRRSTDVQKLLVGVADAVLRSLGDAEIASVASDPSGRIPGAIDRRLIGRSQGALGHYAREEEKILVRKLFLDRCRAKMQGRG